jgi:hypothetical protein
MERNRIRRKNCFWFIFIKYILYHNKKQNDRNLVKFCEDFFEKVKVIEVFIITKMYLVDSSFHFLESIIFHLHKNR